MRRLRVFCLLLTALLPCAAIALDIPAEQEQKLKQLCPQIRLSGGEWLDWKHLMLTPSGTGNSLRLIELINKLLPVQIKVTKAAPFTRQLYQLKEGDNDVLFGLFPLDDRLENYVFTDSYFLEPLFVYANEDKIQEISNIEALHRYKGVYVRGSHYGKTVNQHIKNHPETWKSVGRHIQAVNMVASGRADFYIGSYVSEDLRDFNSHLVKSDHPIAFQEVGAAFSKKTDCQLWIPYINQIIQQNLQPYMMHRF